MVLNMVQEQSGTIATQVQVTLQTFSLFVCNIRNG